MPFRWRVPCVFVSMRKAWSPPSVTTLTKPTRRPPASRAVTQPRLCGRIRSHQPASAFPPWDSTSSTISASVNGPRQRYATPSETNCGRTAGEAKNDQTIRLCDRRVDAASACEDPAVTADPLADARSILETLQATVDARDADALVSLFDDPAVLIGTAGD